MSTPAPQPPAQTPPPPSAPPSAAPVAATPISVQPPPPTQPKPPPPPAQAAGSSAASPTPTPPPPQLLNLAPQPPVYRGPICWNSYCKDPDPNSFGRRGWKVRSGPPYNMYADLCGRCYAQFEQGTYCETFHSEEAGWRECETCSRKVHCGCIVSVHKYQLRDAGGVECSVCCRKRAVVPPSPGWASSVHPPQNLAERKDNTVKSWRPPGQISSQWRQTNMWSMSSVQSDLQQRLAYEFDRPSGSEKLLPGRTYIHAQERKFDDLHERQPTPVSMNQIIRERERDANGHGQPTSLDPAYSYTLYHREGPNPNNIHDPSRHGGENDTLSSRKVGIQDTSAVDAGVKLESHLPSILKDNTPSLSVGLTSNFAPANGPKDPIRIAPAQQQAQMASSLHKQFYSHTVSYNDYQAQMRNGRPRIDPKARSQLLPRYWPRITDQELQHLSTEYPNSNSLITPLFEKMLSASDAGRIGRLVLPKKCAEAYFPPISQPEGLPLKVQDVSGKEWIFQFRFWPNNNSRMYVLEGVTPCIQAMQLQAGDTVTFSRIDPEGKLIMGFRKATNLSAEPLLGFGVLYDKRVPQKLKGKFYRTAIRPVMLYGVECWPTKRRHVQQLSVAKMRVLRWMCGHRRRDRVWNDDIRERVGIAPIEEKLVQHRLREPSTKPANGAPTSSEANGKAPAPDLSPNAVSRQNKVNSESKSSSPVEQATASVMEKGGLPPQKEGPGTGNSSPGTVKRKATSVGQKIKRLRMDSEESMELKITWEEAQDMLRPPPKAPSIVVVDGHEFEEYEEPPILGRKTYFVMDQSGENHQWAQCEDCCKWRKLPVDALLPSKWTCSDNKWDPERSSCGPAQEISLEELAELIPIKPGPGGVKKSKTKIEADTIDASDGLDTLANLAILGEGEALPSQPTTRHPRHRPGCSCIVCIQPPSGKGPKHKQTCTCNVCMTVRRRFRTLMLRREKRQPKKEPGQSSDTVSQTAAGPPATSASTTSAPLKAEANTDGPEDMAGDNKMTSSPVKNQIDLNIQPEREDEHSPKSDAPGAARLLRDNPT
ncbi:hypothetical protein ACP4OV_018921 [Aristida adscensionis]